MTKKHSLALNDSTLAKEAMKDIKKELAGEHVEMLRDYIKGVYRLRYDKEKAIEQLQKEIEVIDEALDKGEKGDVGAVKMVKVPAQYLDEKTVRLAGLDWDES